MITIKNELFEISQYFKTMQKIHTSDKLSVMDAYRINRLVKQVNSLNEEYSELKKSLLEKFGKPVEGQPDQVEISAENREEFSKEMTDLMSIEHSLDIAKLPFPKKITEGISASDLEILDIFFDLSSLEEVPEETTE